MQSKLVWPVLCVFAVLLAVKPADAENGLASYYASRFTGHRTASGERYNPRALTCAHKRLPLGSKVMITYKFRSVVCRVNDRGPFVRKRIVDLSRQAAKQLGLTGTGRIKLQVLSRGKAIK